MERKLKLLGIVSIVIGSIAALLCISPITGAPIIALPIGFIGMICSCIYVFFDIQKEVNKKSFTPGIIGLLLSSAPVLLILAFIIINHFKH
jgi:energy-converting hydrogenase Eha subunit C